jgi:hypothetical protein
VPAGSAALSGNRMSCPVGPRASLKPGGTEGARPAVTGRPPLPPALPLLSADARGPSSAAAPCERLAAAASAAAEPVSDTRESRRWEPAADRRCLSMMAPRMAGGGRPSESMRAAESSISVPWTALIASLQGGTPSRMRNVKAGGQQTTAGNVEHHVAVRHAAECGCRPCKLTCAAPPGRSWPTPSWHC